VQYKLTRVFVARSEIYCVEEGSTGSLVYGRKSCVRSRAMLVRSSTIRLQLYKVEGCWLHQPLLNLNMLTR